ncbi:type II toxin-antitoxin system VapC family toxin [Ornithinimicrobium cavernae]|uniref:type II toxin-antitoxin system VapC family toxin n=1 Tax=Ornithinimicrobium cavernae TaxID=2666047 RepID=UPI000D69187E|nr:type II toxin-antitoxin system VapC family toxin [Ornithinimicrobium cavernae]
MLVIDASVLVVALADDGADGERARWRLRGEQLCAPDLIDLEVVSVLRRLTSVGRVLPHRAELALSDLREMPLQRAGHRDLVPRCWALRDDLTPYDAAYVALAELSRAPLLTADERLAGAAGPQCAIEVLPARG